MKTNVFFSYSFKNHIVIEYYYSMLSKYCQKRLKIFFYDRIYHKKYWGDELKEEISNTDVFIFFKGRKVGITQKKELEYWNDYKRKNAKSILVEIEDLSNMATNSNIKFDQTITFKEKIYNSLSNLYFQIFNQNINYADGLPTNSQSFNYEKHIIDFYTTKYNLSEELKNVSKLESKIINIDKIKEIEEKLQEGIPPTWAEVKINKRIEIDDNKEKYIKISNPLLDEIGDSRDDHHHVLAAALTKYHETKCSNGKFGKFCMKDFKLSFPEAGPRREIYKPINLSLRQFYNIAILVSGGIAPGINAVIDGITRRHFEYADAEAPKYANKLQVWGLIDGFKAFENSLDHVFLYPDSETLSRRQDAINTSEFINTGGSIIGTSRLEKLEKEGEERITFFEDILKQLKDNKINILYIIGGEGTMKAAHTISSMYEKIYQGENDWRFNAVGIPKTMDNDILWVWQTFGFMSAVEKAREIIDYIAVEVSSNPRLGIVQLFGSNSGFVVSHAVLASRTGVCDFALIPESRFTIEVLITKLKNKLKNKNYSLIIASETAVPEDAEKYADKYADKIRLRKEEKDALDDYFNKNNKKIKGHIDDKLRDASFKILKVSIEEEIKYRVLTNEPRHLIRAIPPSTVDIINANRLGSLAVDNALAGYTDFMISQWLTEYCLVPLDLVVLGRKRIPESGIFWKSVIAKTGQEKLY